MFGVNLLTNFNSVELSVLSVRRIHFLLNNMLAVKNFFLPERTKAPPDTSQRFSRMPEALLRSIRRRSLRVKRAKSLVVADREKRKSGERYCIAASAI